MKLCSTIGTCDSANSSRTSNRPFTGGVGPPWPARSPRRELVIGLEVEALLAILGANVEADAVFRPRRLNPVFAALNGEVDVADVSFDDAALEARSLEEFERVLRHAARREDVVRNAVRVGGPVQERSTAASTGRPVAGSATTSSAWLSRRIEKSFL